MSTARTMVQLAALVFAAAVLLPATATRSDAQRVIQGFGRVDQSDVTGPAVTSGDQVAGLFEPGTVPSMVCPVAWGVRTASVRVEDELRQGTLRAALAELEVAPVVQERVADLLIGGAEAEVAADEIAAALTASGNDSREARRAARRLVRRLDGLLSSTQQINPERPGSEAAVRLSGAVSAYNELVDESRADFLAAPPPEFVAVHAALNQLVLAALENQGRATDLTARDAEGAACAAPLPLVPVIAPPLERAMEICVLSASEFRTVAAVFRPETGDTLVIVAGERRPFSEVYPADLYAGDRVWFIEGAPITIAGTEYERYGLSIAARPEELFRVAEYDGVEVFARRGESNQPETLYVPAGPSCEVQPYRTSAAIRRVRG